MTEQDAARILLVRSIEETDRNVFPPSRLSEALAAAANDLRPSSWFLARARYLLDAVPHAYSSIVRMAQLPQGWNIPICVLSFLVGLGTNYLGAFEKIPLMLNPIMALVAWNLLLYMVLIVLLLRSGFKKATRPREPDQPKETGYERPSRSARTQGASPTATPVPSAPWIARVLFPSIWISIHNLTLRFHATRKQATSFVNVAKRFWSHWVEAAQPLVAARWRRLLHGNALSLTAGAIAGMYVRGVFLRYEVIWTSTFITDEKTVSIWVEFTFAPAILASRIAGRDLSADIDIAQLMSPDGAPAASWIHLFVLTAILVIVIPRLVLAGVQGFYVRRAKANIQIDFDDYFARLIRPQIEALITQEIDRGVQNFAQTMANFVCERLYDNRIVPELAQFRASGGRISDLRQRIKQRCEAFRDEISSFAGTAVKELEASVGPGVDRILRAVQQDFRFAATIRQDLMGNLEILPKHEFDRSVKPIGDGFTDAIGVTISASIAVALGTLAGGFGESLEIAVIVALFGTTGPVGFLIGAIVGLIVGAGAWWFGRDKITEQIENITLPSTLVGMVLWQSRFDGLIQEGRVKCHDLVKTRVGELLSPLSSRIGGEVWMRLEQLWSENRNRAATAVQPGERRDQPDHSLES
ncbi:MAG: hypothetical protein ACREQ2_15580 [Candidatus Binatia bacterium]